MNCLRLLIIVVIIASSQTVWGDAEEDLRLVRELAAMLDEKPEGFGSPINDREIWERIARIPAFKDAVADAGKLSGEPVPELPDELFLEFSRTGNRTNYQTPHSRRRSILIHLTIGECIENTGRFIPAIERFARAICTEKTWVLPAHDRKLDNFYGRKTEIHLVPATTAWTMATAWYLLGDSLSPEIRKLIQYEVRRRTFVPFLNMVRSGEDLMWWMTTTNNWNSVCIGGVVGAALAMIESREERAWFLLGVERYSPNYLKGFTPDGYCSEGLAYWNYGFGHYLMLALAVKQATDGKWDMLENEKVKNIARYPVNLEILSGVYPAFADCPITIAPNARYMRYLNRRFGFGIDDWERSPRSSGGNLYELALFEVPDPLDEAALTVQTERKRELRHWFGDAGILISRPHAGESHCLAVALKGGHNGEHHNHNDVGSYVCALGGKALLLDPGSEVYTRRTFSSQRYESDVLNSFGHPVPVIAGKLQKTGEDARGLVLSKRFGENSDTLVLDITSAYDVPELKKLERTFEYSRKGICSLTVTDRIEFTSPETYETALITFSEWRKFGTNLLVVFNGDESLRIFIDTGGKDIEIKAVELKENLQVKQYPTRLGISLKEPVKKAEIRLTIISMKE